MHLYVVNPKGGLTEIVRSNKPTIVPAVQGVESVITDVLNRGIATKLDENVKYLLAVDISYLEHNKMIEWGEKKIGVGTDIEVVQLVPFLGEEQGVIHTKVILEVERKMNALHEVRRLVWDDTLVVEEVDTKREVPESGKGKVTKKKGVVTPQIFNSKYVQ